MSLDWWPFCMTFFISCTQIKDLFRNYYSYFYIFYLSLLFYFCDIRRYVCILYAATKVLSSGNFGRWQRYEVIRAMITHSTIAILIISFHQLLLCLLVCLYLLQWNFFLFFESFIALFCTIEVSHFWMTFSTFTMLIIIVIIKL